MKIVPTILASAVAAASLAASAQAQNIVPMEGTRLDIVATGESARVPDLAMINAAVVTQAPDAGSALSQNSQRMRSVLSALQRAGVAERDIQTSQLSLNPQYDYSERSEPRITGYQATNQLSIRFRDIANAGAILDALVSQGVNQVNGPNLTLDNPDEALNEARQDAVRKARERAQIYATAAGMRVVRIVSISEQGAARPPIAYAGRMAAMDVAEAASTQIVAGEQDIQATVSVTFELQ